MATRVTTLYLGTYLTHNKQQIAHQGNRGNGQVLHDSYVRTFVARDHMHRLKQVTVRQHGRLGPRPLSLESCCPVARPSRASSTKTFDRMVRPLSSRRGRDNADADPGAHPDSFWSFRSQDCDTSGHRVSSFSRHFSFWPERVLRDRQPGARDSPETDTCACVRRHVRLVAWSESTYVTLQALQHDKNDRPT